MHKNILIAVGITFLFLGLAIQPSIATPQLKKIDVEPDIKGLVVQLRVAVNERLEKYESIPKVANIWDIILNLFDLLIKILNKIVEVTLTIIFLPFLIILGFFFMLMFW